MSKLHFLAAALLVASGSVNAAHVAELEYISSSSPNVSLTDGPDPNSVSIFHFPSVSQVYGDSNGVFGVRLSTLNTGGSEGNARYSRTETYRSLGGAADFQLSIDSGSLRAAAAVFGTPALTGVAAAGFTLEVRLNNSVIYSYSPSVSWNGGLIGADLSGINADWDFDMQASPNNIANPFNQGYFWEAQEKNFNLGTFAIGQRFDLTYEISAFVKKSGGADFCGPFDESPEPVNCLEIIGASIDFADPANLNVTGAVVDAAAVPLPGALVLFSSALLGLRLKTKALS